MSDDFYRAFEDKYRGSSELIKSRLLVYLPFVEPLLSIYKEVNAIDLGCGRGEWLELLRDSGFAARGVDLDEGMLAACRERGLNVVTQDAIAALKALPDASQIVVSGFHIAEHLPFTDLQVLVQEALRVLKPAGLLILETPNPENITVGTASFYLDPTHQRPIPPQLLSFLPEHYGYAKVKVLRLQEDKSLAGADQTSLNDVLAGVSPDYAVVGQKFASHSLLACNSDAFEPEYGLTLNVLTTKFDQQARGRAALAESQVQHLGAKTIELEGRLTDFGAKTVELEGRLTVAEAATDQAWRQVKEWHERVVAIHNSSSWKITRPLRAVARAVKRRSMVSKVYADYIAKFRLFVRTSVASMFKLAIGHAKASPGFKRSALRLLRWNPGLQHKLRRTYLENQLIGQSQPENWSRLSTEIVKPLSRNVADASEDDIRIRLLQGINASQRSPLEANFNSYRGRS